MNTNTSNSFENLYNVIKTLRAPGGCPWDREQTPLSMRGDLVEETFEAVDAITTEAEFSSDAVVAAGETDTQGDCSKNEHSELNEQNEKNITHVREELGDVFLNATMISYMYEQKGAFTVADVLDDVSAKIVRRHPHVWPESEGQANANETKAKTADEVLKQWDNIKRGVEGRAEKSVIDEVATGLPPLMRSYKIQKKAAKKGFDWKTTKPVWEKIEEELSELHAAIEEEKGVEEELGDVLFSVVNLARKLHVDPTLALARTNTKFRNRFVYVEEQMKRAGIPMDDEHLKEMDEFWEKAKDNSL